jgi:hypothetical protein
MNRLRLALLLVLFQATAECSSGSNHVEVPDDAGTGDAGDAADQG